MGSAGHSQPAPNATQPEASPARLDAIDWLRGLAVVLMIQAHGFDAWLAPAAKTGFGYSVIRHASGLPSRMFLLLVGVSVALRFEKQLQKGATAAAMRWLVAKRGLQVLVLAYVFRLQEHALAGFRGSWQVIFRVDILNAIGASMLLLAAVATPRRGRPQIAAALAAAAVFVALGPVVGPAVFPDWLPRPLTSYIGGQRPMAWFPVFPWAAWALVGVALGHFWVRASADRRGQARFFAIAGLAGVAATSIVVLVRELAPSLISYPSDLVMAMGPGSFFFRLGIIGALATLAWGVTAASRGRFSPLRQLGRTSLLVYWIHVDLCYGVLARPLQRRLSIPRATLWIAGLVLAMLVVSIVKTRMTEAIAGRRQQRKA